MACLLKQGGFFGNHFLVAEAEAGLWVLDNSGGQHQPSCTANPRDEVSETGGRVIFPVQRQVRYTDEGDKGQASSLIKHFTWHAASLFTPVQFIRL